MSNKLSQEQLAGRMLHGGFERKAPAVQRLPDPVADTPMYLTLDDIAPYDTNPRTTRNEKYDEIKQSIRERGLDHPPSITRRPGADKFMIRDGGNTRLTILRELWQETKDERYYRLHCLFRPWNAERGELVVLTGHLAENDVRGDLMFIERAVGVDRARQLYEQENGGQAISQRELARRLKADGYPISHSHISRMQETIRVLLPAIPTLLYSGLGKHQVEKLLSLHSAAEQVWNDWLAEKGPDAEVPNTEFEPLFQNVLNTFENNDTQEFVYRSVQDELIGQMALLTGVGYESILRALDDKQKGLRRSNLIPLPEALPEELAAESVQTLPAPLAGETTPPAAATPTREARDRATPTTPPSQPKSVPAPTDTGTGNADAASTEHLSDEERQARIDGHIVTPVQTSARVEQIRRQIAAADGETLPDFNANALVSIPVQAGGLHPISDVWYIERVNNFPHELRPICADLAREIASLAGLDPALIQSAAGGLGFTCEEPAEDQLDALSDAAFHAKLLLQSLSGVWLVALQVDPEQTRAAVVEFEFAAQLGALLLGQPARADQPAQLADRLSDAAVVKLFRLIRLGRRLVELETEA